MGRWNKSSPSLNGMTTVVNPEYTKPSSPQSGANEVELGHHDEPYSPPSAPNDVDLVRQDDEILTISAMYPECFAQEDPAAEPREFEVSFAGCALQVTLPSGYPSCEPPQIRIIHRDYGVSKEVFAAWQSAIQEAAAFLCTDVFVEGEECLFGALEDIQSRLQIARDAAELSQQSDLAAKSASVPPELKDVSDTSVRDEAFVCLHHLNQGNDPKEKPLFKLMQHMGLDAVVFYGRPCLLHIQGAPEDVDAFVGQCKSRKVTISISLAQRSQGPAIEAGVTRVPAKKGTPDDAALKAHLDKRGFGETSYSLISNNVPKGCC
eukprot:gnl/MRDRNA2_/MRDRNA2_144098_c0_seq1.p1 gnl/MRDRNA2_/MRDRNA2_144098_c0~~gnl/MRDRNA2_/MRDRNA2_144098_c0_seq1.p1  ORF type:complete len:320 (+),score=55.13 gnl/MRDRNA2_/MRDRNA2_144098_c0_seq1:131-1090(+)